MAKKQDYADRGNFRGFKNLSKEHGDDRPLFQGTLTLPGSKDKRAFALWPNASKTDGSTILSGRASATANSQIAAYTQPNKEDVERVAVELPGRNGDKPFKIDPDTVMMFPNKTKDAENEDRPDFYGFFNPGDGKLQRIAAWSSLDRNGNPMLTGSLQAYEQRMDREQDDAGPPAPEEPEPAREREPEYSR